MTPKKAALEVESTGDVAFDKILGGGIPAQSVVVIAGEPGFGKTVLTLQMLFRAAAQGKTCLYFTTLSEPAIKVIRYMQLFDFFDATLLETKVIFLDLSEIAREGSNSILEEIDRRVEEHEPGFIAIDSFRALTDLVDPDATTRPFVYEVAVKTTAWGATTLLVGEYTREESAGFAEFAVADAIFRLGSVREELTSVREVEVLKLRGCSYVPGRHFFEIGAAGVSFYPRVSAPFEGSSSYSAPSGGRAAIGVEGLDELLGGGLPRGSANVVQGGTGTGKTLCCLRFLLAGVAAGEKAVFFTLEETPEQLRSSAQSLGWDLPKLEADGLLEIVHTSPVELSTDKFLYEARLAVKALGARRVVFDSLTTMALGIVSERRYKEMVYAIVKHMRGEGLTLMATVESEQLLGSASLSGYGISFVADNLIQLRYVEIEGRLERAISVLKARGIKHSSELRSFVIDENGLHVTPERFRDFRGVLTGVPDLVRR